MVRITVLHQMPEHVSDIQGVVFEPEHTPQNLIFTQGKHVLQALAILSAESNYELCKPVFTRLLTSLESPSGVESYFLFGAGADKAALQVWTRVNTYDCDRRMSNLAARLYGIVQRTWGDTAPVRILSGWNEHVNVLAAYDLKRAQAAESPFIVDNDLVMMISEERRVPNHQPTMTDFTEDLDSLSAESKHAIGRVAEYLNNPDGNANGYYVRDITRVIKSGEAVTFVALFTLDDLIAKRSFKVMVRDPMQNV